MTDNPVKVLVFGAVLSENLTQVIDKTRAVNDKNGPFSLVILLGSFLDDHKDVIDFLNGKLNATIPFYVEGSMEIVKKLVGEDLSDNITILEPFQITRTISGISIVYNNDNVADQSSNAIHDVDIMISNAILATSDLASINSTLMTFMQKIRPRYYLTSTKDTDTFHELAPFKWNPKEDRICRMIQLARYGAKSKNIYAFSISKNMGIVSETALRPNPFEPVVVKPKRSNQGDRRMTKRQKKQTILPETCFFCLSNPNLDKSLIVSIGEESYLALAKGPLMTKQAEKALGFSGHLLSIPFAHVPTYSSLPNDSAAKTMEERHKYITAIKSMFSENGLNTIWYEISRSRGVHVSTQIIPIEKDLINNLETTFMKELRNAGLEISRDGVKEGENDYVFINFGDDKKSIKGIIPAGVRFDMALCRRVVADALDISDQTDWKRCIQSAEDEKKDGQTCRERFKKFDFTLAS